MIVVAIAVIALVYGRSEGRPFHLPLGDGGWVAVAGAWCTLLILSRLLERPLGQTLLALASAAILVLAGVRQHARRPADDLPRFVRRSLQVTRAHGDAPRSTAGSSSREATSSLR